MQDQSTARRRPIARMLAALARLPRDRRGAAAVEFALVVPFVAVVYMGGSDTAMAVSINRKIHNAAGTIGDLVGQVEATTPILEVMALIKIGLGGYVICRYRSQNCVYRYPSG